MVLLKSLASYKIFTTLRIHFVIAVVWLCASFIVYYRYTSCSDLHNIQLEVPLKQFDYKSNIGPPIKQKFLPTCIIFGVKKAGTGALLEYLGIHPDIEIRHKESHFFYDDDEYGKGLEYYRHQMPYSFQHQITVEKTPNYFNSLDAPERIYQMNSSIRLLLIVRNPVTRLVSDYIQSKRKNSSLPDSFESAVLDSDGNINTQFQPINVSLYSVHFARWIKRFPRKQIHIVDGDNLVKDPFKEMHEVETFLGLEHKIKRRNFKFNDKKKFFCIVKQGMNTCFPATKGVTHPYVKPSVLKKLRDFFKESNTSFFKMSNKTYNW